MDVRANQTPTRRGVALLLTVLMIAIMLAIAAQLATLSATSQITTSRRVNTVQHRLAAECTMGLLARAMRENTDLERMLDRDKRAIAEFDVGLCHTRVLIADDGAKFNLLPYAEPASRQILIRKLDDLSKTLRLPQLELDLKPILRTQVEMGRTKKTLPSFVCLDQLFKTPLAPQVFHWSMPSRSETPDSVWSDVVSLWGDGRIDLRRADPRVAALALSDVSSGFSLSYTDAPAFQQALAGLDEGVRRRVAGRVGYSLDRYALTIQTIVGSDTRRWYMVATIRNGAASLLHFEQITW